MFIMPLGSKHSAHLKYGRITAEHIHDLRLLMEYGFVQELPRLLDCLQVLRASGQSLDELWGCSMLRNDCS